MAAPKLTSYLRAFRKKSGLTLCDVAYLLDISPSDLSRYEKRLREVPFRVALSCCLLYGFTVRQVFAGMYELCASLLIRRLKLLRNRLNRNISKSGQSGALAYRLAWITTRLANVSALSL